MSYEIIKNKARLSELNVLRDIAQVSNLLVYDFSAHWSKLDHKLKLNAAETQELRQARHAYEAKIQTYTSAKSDKDFYHMKMRVQQFVKAADTVLALQD